MAATTDLAQLLGRHTPVLRYDSQEPYFADAASEWTDNPGNQLKRADGTVIAAATPTGGQPPLSLEFLGPGRYANGDAVVADDRIGVTSKDYVAAARTMHAQPKYANRVYGHSATGRDGRLWLAYWFFYFYNDYNLVGPFIKAGLHEGDWEMIQLRLDPTSAVPDLAVYAQHAHAGQRPWNQVERVGEQPVVYPARGSHASYFSADVHWTGAWFDFADGKRPAPPLTLEILSDVAGVDGWAVWPGMWGGTTPTPGDSNPLDDSSPRGPGGHAQYKDPDVLLATAAAHEAALAAAPAPPPPPTAPSVSAVTVGNDLQVTYDTHIATPSGLVVAVGDLHDPTPPAIHRRPIDSPSGTVTIPGAGAEAAQSVHVSVAADNAPGSPAATVISGSPPPAGEMQPQTA
jgi:hypothetical protein